MDYNSIVSSLRSVARDMLRMKATNSVRDALLCVNNQLNRDEKRYEETILALQKDIAVRNYAFSKIEDADPQAEEKRENIQKSDEIALKEIETLETTSAKSKEEYQKEIARLELEIAKIQSGESLVDKEELSRVTESLIQEVTEEAVRTKLVEAIKVDSQS